MTGMASHSAAALRVVDLVSDNEDRRYEPAGRMAAVIVDITREKGGCLPQDVQEAGFAPADVARDWHMARALASVELKLLGCA